MTSKQFLISAVIIFSIPTSHCFGQKSEKDPRLLALFIYKFTEHITWPSQSEKMLVGVLGAPDVLEELKKIEASRPRIVVKAITSSEQAEDVDLLFLCSEMKSEYRTYTKSLSKKSTLLVCEDKADWRLGIDIAFIMTSGRLSYFLDQGNLQRRGLVASSRLLGLGG